MTSNLTTAKTMIAAYNAQDVTAIIGAIDVVFGECDR